MKPVNKQLASKLMTRETLRDSSGRNLRMFKGEETKTLRGKGKNTIKIAGGTGSQGNCRQVSTKPDAW